MKSISLQGANLPLHASNDYVVHTGGSDIREAPAAVTGKGTEVGAIGQIEDAIRVRELWLFRRVVVIPTNAEDYPFRHSKFFR